MLKLGNYFPDRFARTMPSTTLSELDGLFHQLQRRMVESGEWDRYDLWAFPDVAQWLKRPTLVFRILLQLRYQLRDAGWLDSTHAQMLGASVRLWPVVGNVGAHVYRR